jgi:excinuclease ABC subunit C
MNAESKEEQTTLFRDNPAEYPDQPGVYLFKDEAGRIIYVGKAKVLRKRLASYFQSPERLTPKTRVMLSRAGSVNTICTSSEKEALLLEASLIKKHRPRYNIVLRDDKRYLLFKIDTRKRYPRIELTRKVGRDRADYFGPFASADKARQTLRAINRIFPIRKCSDRNFKNRVRPCLQYHLNRCLAPCVYDVPVEKYRNIISKVSMFLRGKSSLLIQEMEKDMHRAAEELRFEAAAALRDQIKAVRDTVERQAVVIPGGGDMDVLGWSYVRDGLCLGVIFVREGKMLDSRNFFWPEQKLEEDELSNLLVSFLSQFYTPESFIPPRIVLPGVINDTAIDSLLKDYRGDSVKLEPAQSTATKELVGMAAENSRLDHLRSERDRDRVRLARPLGLNEEPRHIECVDVSHQSGENPRAGKVVAVDGEFEKNEYRVYNIPDAVGGDDYAALRDFILRRLDSGPPWPDLLLIDGGRGQVNTVHECMRKEGVPELFPVAGIAKGPSRRKGELEDRVFVPGRKNPLNIPPGGKELLFLQRLRDEAHRFVLGRMRNSRSSTQTVSSMESIPGVGPETATLLRERFGTLQALAKAEIAELESVPGIGPKKAEKIKEYIKSGIENKAVV